MDIVTTNIPMVLGEPRKAETYGIIYESLFRYTVFGWGSQTLGIRLWNNEGRLNTRNGQPVQYGSDSDGFSWRMNGGNGKYLDPDNNATDDTESVLMGPASFDGRELVLEPLTRGTMVRLFFYRNEESYLNTDCVRTKDYTITEQGRYYANLIEVR